MLKPFRDWSIFRKIATISVGSVLLFLLLVFFWLIPFLENRMLNQRASASRELVEIALAEIRHIRAEVLAGRMEEAAAKKFALTSVSSTRYSANGYFWVHDYDNRMIAHTIQPGIVNRDFTNVTDANGVRYIPEMTRVAIAGGGIVKYLWPHPGQEVPTEKISYAAAFPEWRWVVGTGIYTEDLIAEFAALRRQVAFGALFLAVGAMVVTMLTAHRLTRPLKNLVGAAARVANGDLEVKVNARSMDEVGQLCAAFNRMTEDLGLMVEQMKIAQEEREQLTEQLHHSQKLESVGRLAGGVAHDFNNMLGVIIGYVDMLKNQVGKESALFEDLEEIHKAAQRSATITRQLLAFARRQTAVPRIIDLNALVGDSLNMVGKLIGEDIKIEWNPGNPLGKVKMDPDQFAQIFTNLAANARDAMDRSGVLRLETANQTIDDHFAQHHPGATPGDYVKFTVADSGCGIDTEKMEKIFDPFYTTKDIGEGTGLGLSTVHGIVKQNGGFITVESVVGQRTAFNIHLPRVSGQNEEKESEQGTEGLERGTETILVVEDEPGLLKLTARTLEKFGYRVLAAQTPARALKFASEGATRIDLLLTDIVMPEMNGWDLSQNLRTAQPTMRCLYMSGYSHGIIAKKGIRMESLNYLRKPFTTKELQFRVRQALDEQASEEAKISA